MGNRQYVDDIRFLCIASFSSFLPPHLEPHCHRCRWRSFRLVANWETDMTIFQDAPVLRDSAPVPAPLLPLAPGEPRAMIAILSAAKRNALVACFNASGLHKKDGAWHGLADGKPVSGVTVADLARDGMLTLNTDRRLGSARLTERGNWFARTLLRDAIAAK
jgi:hypothetical protein